MVGAIAVALCLIAVPAKAQSPVFDVAVWIFPPFAYVDDDGTPHGQAVDTIKAVLTEMGYEPKLTVLPFKRCLADMRHGLIPMMLPCATNEERRAFMQYSAPIYYITTKLWKKGKELSSCWKDYNDLAGLRIGVGLGYSYGEDWDAAVESEIFSLDLARGNSAELTHFRMAAEERIDMFISDLAVGAFIKEQYAPEFDDIYPCPKIIGEKRPFGAPVSRKYFDDRGLSTSAFLARFNAVLKRIQAGD
ncbi:transporter substrate-binding domain-containing protein [Pseudodesulfovibrio cashew]|uniref:Transporter substrate-binding domain-containing protein n=1 Tax=Pseudodesulfovibrio cashew TaxID=2678688 RepID=A0A6I6JCU1_9BACT|nr:transporter substrate-binding domain-containing protein [Pseudodesulfovibrio cashew]QGY38870.1 transporter substrate-binding domain-containing protein [Pseudodesulfovibrio cashew]